MKHVHKYIRRNIGANKPYYVYACADSCSHYIMEKLIAGKKSRCWSCDQIFVIKKKGVTKPTCESCRKARAGESDVENLLKGIGVI